MNWKEFKNLMKGIIHKSEFKYNSPEEIMNTERVIKAMKQHVLRNSVVGAGVGGAGGATAGALVGKKITPEQEKRNKELKEWWKGLSNKEKNQQINIDHFEKNYVHSRLKRGLQGLVTGAVTGGLGTHAVSGVNAVRAVKRYANLVDKSMVRDAEGKMHATRSGLKDLLVKAKDVIVNDERPLRTTDIFGRTKVVDRKKAYEQLLDDVNPGIITPTLDNSAKDLRDSFLSDFAKAMNGVKLTKDTDSIIAKLKAEGISTHRQFSKKYHPDVNSNVPKSIKENYGQIYDVLRGNTPGGRINPMDSFVDKFKSENSDRISKARDIIKKYTERYHED